MPDHDHTIDHILNHVTFNSAGILNKVSQGIKSFSN